ncbi:MAG: hypothetical protein ACD_15C00150G0002 [uncultured bacterium]|nr:MAG: hypothetical protein ACD_15C00150G0002 [uncultured bacterium]
MENRFKIVGKNMTPEKRDYFSEKRKESEEESKKPFVGEMEKSEKAREIIRFINACIAEKFQELGLEYQEIPEEKNHLFSKEGFKKAFPNKDDAVNGFNNSVNKENIIKVTEDSAKVFKVMLHEMVHAASHGAYYGDIQSNKLREYRTGYVVSNWHDGEENVHEHFRAFNEGMIDLIVSEIVKGKLDDINKLLEISKEDWKNVSWYWDESELINLIVGKISDVKREKGKDIYARFEKGLFTGEMMHLRDVEKVFGKHSLRILGSWDSTDKGGDPDKVDRYRKIYKFFATDDEGEREKLRQELLPEISDFSE